MQKNRAMSRPALFGQLAALLLLSACLEPIDEGTLTSESRRAPDFGLETSSHEAHKRVCADKVIKGIDVSKWQGKINWEAVSNDRIKFAFIRVSDGLEYDDPYFQRNWRAAKKNGVVRAAYQFFRPGQDPIEQANYLLNEMGPLEPGDLPPVLDLEVTDGKSNDLITKKTRRWLAHVEEALGVAPIVYTSPSFWDAHITSPEKFSATPLWVAHWTDDCPLVPRPWKRWTFWQFSSHGQVKGIGGRVDVNRFNGSLAELRAYAGAPTEPECGDTICEADEIASDCSLDCGESEFSPDTTGGCSIGRESVPWSAASILLACAWALRSRRRHARPRVRK